MASEIGFIDEKFYACVLSASGQTEGKVLIKTQLELIEEVHYQNKMKSIILP